MESEIIASMRKTLYLIHLENIMELAHLKIVYIVFFFYLAVNKEIINMTKHFSFVVELPNFIKYS